MRKTRELAAWPLFTGEDVPGDDASTVARCLIVPFIWEPGQPNPALTEAQSLASHLTAIGRTWLDWLVSPEGQAAAQLIVQSFPQRRDDWLARLNQLNPQMRNPARVMRPCILRSQASEAYPCPEPCLPLRCLSRRTTPDDQGQVHEWVQIRRAHPPQAHGGCPADVIVFQPHRVVAGRERDVGA